MSLSFEITEDDVGAVLTDAGYLWDGVRNSELLYKLDTDAVEKAALHGDDMDDQVIDAHEEIRRQLEKMGFLPSNDGSSFAP